MTVMQLELCLDARKPSSLVGIVRQVMAEHEWLTLYQMQKLVERKCGEWHSDATISARVRDLRKERYGGYMVQRRKKEGTGSFEYRLMGSL